MPDPIDFECKLCGLKIANAIPPVRHNCKSRGLGDTVAKVLSSVGIKKSKNCKCSQRQDKLNKLVPYKSGQ